jgi:hypothetical protein
VVPELLPNEIDDPDMWDKPWGGEYTFHPLKGVTLEADAK